MGGPDLQRIGGAPEPDQPVLHAAATRHPAPARPRSGGLWSAAVAGASPYRVFPVLVLRPASAVCSADKISMRAKTKPKHAAKKAKRPIGLAKGKLKVIKSFFKPLPDKLLDAFESKS